jgi:DNA polymerase-3 subunit delta'
MREDAVKNYFPRLIGNEETKNRIGKAIESGRLPHAFLIGGPSGSGKSTLAIEIAAAMNCKGEGDSLPCARCESCRRIYEGIYPDVKILSKAKDRATLGVEAIKDFREDMFLSSTESEHKIYIIDDAECMTPEAQNALLKVLEEPPRSVRIILLARECDRILTTIKSRAQYVAMSRFTDEELAKRLLSESADARAIKSTDEERFLAIIMSADGRLGLAKKLVTKRLADENLEERDDAVAIIRSACGRSSYTDIHAAISALPTKRTELCDALERVMNAIRDLIVIKYDSKAKTVFFPSPEAAVSACGDIPKKRLIALYDAVNETHSLCQRNAYLPNIAAGLASKIKLAEKI